MKDERRGRPSLDRDHKRKCKVCISLTNDQDALLKQLAYTQGLRPSQLAWEIVLEYIEKSSENSQNLGYDERYIEPGTEDCDWLQDD